MSESAISSIGAVIGRMKAIERRFAPEPSSVTRIVSSSIPFDPFGEAYERALAARPIDSSSPATTASAARLVERPAVLNTSTPEITTSGATTGIGGYGSMPIPPVLAPYGNGHIPDAMLAPIEQPGHRLYAPAAASWDQLVDAAAADGFDLRITDSYRSYDQQVDLAGRKGLYSEGGLAAVPGTSNHGWGLAVDADVSDPALLAWIREHGRDFGWVEAVPREPWHWEFRPHQV